MWGERRTERWTAVPTRTTPVCVGRTEGLGDFADRVQDNPRMCGENRAGAAALAASCGQPPYVWGEHRCHPERRHRRRTTPVCVGRTCQECMYLVYLWDNPRMCGENLYLEFVEFGYGGQPPYVWGEHGDTHEPCGYNRTTPVCVGRTPEFIEPILLLVGQPPYVWGELADEPVPAIPDRTTPVCVGRTRIR